MGFSPPITGSQYIAGSPAAQTQCHDVTETAYDLQEKNEQHVKFKCWSQDIHNYPRVLTPQAGVFQPVHFVQHNSLLLFPPNRTRMLPVATEQVTGY